MEASARKKKRPLAAIPENLEELSKPELIKIIQSLRQQVAKKHKGDEVDAKALQAMRKRLRDKIVKAVKKTAHNDRRKPYSEISDGCASRDVAVALMGGLHPTSDTARMTRWVLATSDDSARGGAAAPLRRRGDSFPGMMALGGFFLIFEPIPGSSAGPRLSMWVRGERGCWSGPERSSGCPRRHRRGVGVSEALEAFTGGRGRAGRVDSTSSLGAGPEASGALPEL